MAINQRQNAVRIVKILSSIRQKITKNANNFKYLGINETIDKQHYSME